MANIRINYPPSIEHILESYYDVEYDDQANEAVPELTSDTESNPSEDSDGSPSKDRFELVYHFPEENENGDIDTTVLLGERFSEDSSSEIINDSSSSSESEDQWYARTHESHVDMSGVSHIGLEADKNHLGWQAAALVNHALKAATTDRILRCKLVWKLCELSEINIRKNFLDVYDPNRVDDFEEDFWKEDSIRIMKVALERWGRTLAQFVDFFDTRADPRPETTFRGFETRIIAFSQDIRDAPDNMEAIYDFFLRIGEFVSSYAVIATPDSEPSGSDPSGSGDDLVASLRKHEEDLRALAQEFGLIDVECDEAEHDDPWASVIDGWVEIAPAGDTEMSQDNSSHYDRNAVLIDPEDAEEVHAELVEASSEDENGVFTAFQGRFEANARRVSIKGIQPFPDNDEYKRQHRFTWKVLCLLFTPVRAANNARHKNDCDDDNDTDCKCPSTMADELMQQLCKATGCYLHEHHLLGEADLLDMWRMLDETAENALEIWAIAYRFLLRCFEIEATQELLRLFEELAVKLSAAIRADADDFQAVFDFLYGTVKLAHDINYVATRRRNPRLPDVELNDINTAVSRSIIANKIVDRYADLRDLPGEVALLREELGDETYSSPVCYEDFLTAEEVRELADKVAERAPMVAPMDWGGVGLVFDDHLASMPVKEADGMHVFCAGCPRRLMNEDGVGGCPFRCSKWGLWRRDLEEIEHLGLHYGFLE